MNNLDSQLNCSVSCNLYFDNKEYRSKICNMSEEQIMIWTQANIPIGNVVPIEFVDRYKYCGIEKREAVIIMRVECLEVQSHNGLQLIRFLPKSCSFGNYTEYINNKLVELFMHRAGRKEFVVYGV